MPSLPAPPPLTSSLIPKQITEDKHPPLVARSLFFPGPPSPWHLRRKVRMYTSIFSTYIHPSIQIQFNSIQFNSTHHTQHYGLFVPHSEHKRSKGSTRCLKLPSDLPPPHTDDYYCDKNLSIASKRRGPIATYRVSPHNLQEMRRISSIPRQAEDKSFTWYSMACHFSTRFVTGSENTAASSRHTNNTLPRAPIRKNVTQNRY